MAGIGISSTFLAGLISGCKPETTGINYRAIMLDQENFTFLRNLTEALIPQSDTPGAIELGLAEWIDTIVKKCYTENDQKQFLSNLIAVNAALNGKTSKSSLSSLESSLTNTESLKDAYQSIKSMVATAYLANEYVGTKLLNYLPVPGEYVACIPISKTNGKAWTI